MWIKKMFQPSQLTTAPHTFIWLINCPWAGIERLLTTAMTKIVVSWRHRENVSIHIEMIQTMQNESWIIIYVIPLQGEQIDIKVFWVS